MIYIWRKSESFTYNGKSYTPKVSYFIRNKAEDYISLTSYTHRKYYSDFILRIPTIGIMEPFTIFH